MEKKEQMLINDDENREGACSQNRLMKVEKDQKRAKKKVIKRVLNQGWESIKREIFTE